MVDEISKSFVTSDGLKQGDDSLSNLLFNIAVERAITRTVVSPVANALRFC